MKTISLIQLYEMIGDDKYQIVDLREREAYEVWHVEGAISIPYEDLVRGKKDLDFDKIIVLYCERGNMSIMAARYLDRLGYSTQTVVGKIEDFH